MSNYSALQNELIAEADRIMEDGIHSAKGHFNASTIWNRRHYWIGIPAALMGVLAGSTAFTSWASITALAGFLAASLSTVSTFLNPQDKALQHKKLGDQYLALRNQARIFKNIEVQTLAMEMAKERLQQLALKRDELNNASLQIPRKAYEQAKVGISNGESTYKTDAGVAV
jgi:hypothetical protein